MLINQHVQEINPSLASLKRNGWLSTIETSKCSLIPATSLRKGGYQVRRGLNPWILELLNIKIAGERIFLPLVPLLATHHQKLSFFFHFGWFTNVNSTLICYEYFCYTHVQFFADLSVREATGRPHGPQLCFHQLPGRCSEGPPAAVQSMAHGAWSSIFCGILTMAI